MLLHMTLFVKTIRACTPTPPDVFIFQPVLLALFRHAFSGVLRNFCNPLVHFDGSILLLAEQFLGSSFQTFGVQSSS